jgi:hypothetical protein
MVEDVESVMFTFVSAHGLRIAQTSTQFVEAFWRRLDSI